MKSLNIEIAKRVKSYRKKNKYSQENMADMLGLSRASYINMEGGRQAWAAIYIYNLCRIFKCRINNLFPKITPVKVKYKLRTRRVVVSKKRKVFSQIK